MTTQPVTAKGGTFYQGNDAIPASPEYEAARAAHGVAIAAFGLIQQAFRSRRCDVVAYMDGRGAMARADALFDAAFRAEERRCSAPLSVRIGPAWVPALSLIDASRAVREEIQGRMWGAREWYGIADAGHVRDRDGNHVATVSYNGRLWQPGEQTEIKASEGTRARVWP